MSCGGRGMALCLVGWIQRVRMTVDPVCDTVWMRSTSQVGLVVLLLCLAVANIAQRARWNEVEDGVLWRASGNDVVAAEVAPGTGGGARRTPGGRRPPRRRRPAGHEPRRTSSTILHASSDGHALHYTVLRRARSRWSTIVGRADSVESARPVFHARRGRHFLAAGRRVRAAAPPRITRRRCISSG